MKAPTKRLQQLRAIITKREKEIANEAAEQEVSMDCTCGTCGEKFGDLYPSGRCPFEYEHEEIAELRRLEKRLR